MSHHFISYSVGDAQEFAFRLHDALEGGRPNVAAWLDKRDIKPAMDWDTQIVEGIRDCDSLLFVLTPDSVTDTSTCKLEWSLALKYKKPIVLLMLRYCDVPFRLQNRQYIDFSTDFDSGIVKLRSHTEWLASPGGELQRLRDRLEDAQRDLRRAKDDLETARIQDEMNDLKKRIADQQKLVDNPEGAARHTQENIERALESERQPEKPISDEHVSKFINPLPGIVPDYFQGRQVETKMVADFLRHESQRLMTIVGRGGVGKTAMVCRLLKGLESSKLPDDLPPMPIDGIVYLSETGSRRANVANLFSDLGKLLPKEKAEELDGVYKNPQATTEIKVRKLLEAFPQGRYVLLLDNFEDTLDENRKLKDAELDDALKTMLKAPPHGLKIIITTREKPRELLLLHPERQRLPLELEHGLESPYAENVLREMDKDGILGLKNADDATLKNACERVRGYPRALEALVAGLAVDRETTLDDILQVADKQLPEQVTQALVGEAFNRLDATAQRVVQALAAYGRPVPEVAVDYLLQPHLPGINSAPILGRLVNMHFARRESGRYYLHPVDRQYALTLIPKGEASDRFEMRIPPLFTQISLYHWGAQYFASTRKPREEWKKLEDLRPQLDEFDLRSEAGDWDTAATVLTNIDFECLLLWGHFRLMAAMHEQLQGKIKDMALQSRSASNLGTAYWSMSQIDKAFHYFERALVIAREHNDLSGQGKCLGNLGTAHRGLGEVEIAIEYYKQALAINREIGDRRSEGILLNNLGLASRELGQLEAAIEPFKQALAIARENRDKRSEGMSLSNLGLVYSELGEMETAIDYCGQALAIDREISNKRGEEIRLGNLGNAYSGLGQMERAFEYYKQAIEIARKIGDLQGESIGFENVGHAFGDQGRWREAIHSYQQAIQIADEISFPQTQNLARWGLALVHLYSSDLILAREAAEASAKYDVPQNNHHVFVTLGVIALRRGDIDAAKMAFMEAVVKADTILARTAQLYDALEAKGLALCGLAILGDPTIEDAKSAYRAARKITTAKGIVGRVLQLFDALAVADTAGVLAGVRDVAAGKESEI